MPEDKGAAMPTADLHGSTIAIETGKGEKTTFELVRLGTVKEHETVKAALATTKTQLDGLDAEVVRMVEKGRGLTEKLQTSDDAYTDLKERYNELAKDHVARGGENEKLRDEITTVRDELTTAESAFKAVEDANGNLVAAIEAEESITRQLRAELTSQNEITDGLSDEAESFRAEIAEKESELESVKTAADVSKVERDRYEKERDDTKAAFASLTERQARGEREFLEVSRERDVSRQALADLKAELLRDAGCMSDILDAMHKKITGE